MSFKEYTIEDCCDILDNQRIPLNSDQRFEIPGEYPYYGANGVQGYISKYLFNDDLILIAEDGGNFEQFASRPIAYRVKGKCWVNNHAHVIKAKEGFSQDFIFYSLEHKDILFYISGGTRSKLNQSELKRILIKHPLKPEADKIGEILSTADKAIEQTEKLIAKYQRIKTGLMQDLLTKGIDEHGNIRSKATHKFVVKKGVKVPEEWDVEKLVDVSTILVSNVDKKTKIGEERVFLCNYMDVYTNREIKKNFPFMEATATPDEIQKFSLKIDDVIITKDSETPNDIAVPSVVKEILPNLICGYHLALLRPEERLVGYFLMFQFLQHYAKKHFGSLASGSTRFGLSLNAIETFKVLIPNKDEQEKIIERINSINVFIEQEKNNLLKLSSIKTGLMQDLLNGRVRVDAKGLA